MNRRLVYTVKRPGDKKPTGLALNCHLWHGVFRYFDMEHGHEIPGKVTEERTPSHSLRRAARPELGNLKS